MVQVGLGTCQQQAWAPATKQATLRGWTGAEYEEGIGAEVAQQDGTGTAAAAWRNGIVTVVAAAWRNGTGAAVAAVWRNRTGTVVAARGGSSDLSTFVPQSYK